MSPLFQGEFSWIWNSWLTVYFFQHLEGGHVPVFHLSDETQPCVPQGYTLCMAYSELQLPHLWVSGLFISTCFLSSRSLLR